MCGPLRIRDVINKKNMNNVQNPVFSEIVLSYGVLPRLASGKPNRDLLRLDVVNFLQESSSSARASLPTQIPPTLSSLHRRVLEICSSFWDQRALLDALTAAPSGSVFSGSTYTPGTPGLPMSNSAINWADATSP